MWTLVDTAAGPIRVVGDGEAVTVLGFETQAPPEASSRSSMRAAAERAAQRDDGERDDDDPVLREAGRQLQAYFAHELREFDLPLRPRGTEFQQRVWAELQKIGFGQTASYGELARRLGLPPGASRAVGSANGRNPIAIVIPCHRVVGSDGKLTGYAGGVERKQMLLALEQADDSALF